MNPIEIRDYINEAMLKQGVTQTELAKRTGIPQGNISRYLNSDPSDTVSPTALRLLEALGYRLTVEEKE